MGIEVNKEELEFIGSNKRINDFVEVWLCKKDVEICDLKLEPLEVQNANWYNIDEFESMIENGTCYYYISFLFCQLLIY